MLNIIVNHIAIWHPLPQLLFFFFSPHASLTKQGSTTGTGTSSVDWDYTKRKRLLVEVYQDDRDAFFGWTLRIHSKDSPLAVSRALSNASPHLVIVFPRFFEVEKVGRVTARSKPYCSTGGVRFGCSSSVL